MRFLDQKDKNMSSIQLEREQDAEAFDSFSPITSTTKTHRILDSNVRNWLHYPMLGTIIKKKILILCYKMVVNFIFGKHVFSYPVDADNFLRSPVWYVSLHSDVNAVTVYMQIRSWKYSQCLY